MSDLVVILNYAERHLKAEKHTRERELYKGNTIENSNFLYHLNKGIEFAEPVIMKIKKELEKMNIEINN